MILSTTDPGCELKCATLSVDMGTFECPSWCQNFCKLAPSTKKCELKVSWKNKVKQGPPPHWIDTSEKPSKWTQEELKMVFDALSKVSDAFPVEELTGIFKLDKPRDVFSAGACSSYVNAQVVLYESAFLGREKIDSYLVHELAHHLHETALKTSFDENKKSMKWPPSGQPRPSAFVDPDGKDSPMKECTR